MQLAKMLDGEDEAISIPSNNPFISMRSPLHASQGDIHDSVTTGRQVSEGGHWFQQPCRSSDLACLGFSAIDAPAVCPVQPYFGKCFA